MKRKFELIHPNLPQLRQMVLKNTERINRNEMAVDKLFLENVEQALKNRERDECWENSRREHERNMRSIDARLDRIALLQEKSIVEQDKRNCELKEQFAETDRRMEESTRKLKEQFAETKKLIEENAEQIKVTQKQMEETSKEVKLLSRQFNGETGHIVEGLVSSSVEKLFWKFGIDLHNSGKNLKRKLKSENMQMEVDVLLGNDKMVVPIEVKTKFTEENLNWFLQQMQMFRKLFPEFDSKEVVAAIAAIDYDKGVDALAHKEKLLVIRVNSDDIFSIDPFEEKALRRF